MRSESMRAYSQAFSVTVYIAHMITVAVGVAVTPEPKAITKNRQFK